MWEQSAPPTPQSVDTSAEPTAENGNANSFSPLIPFGNVSYFHDRFFFFILGKTINNNTTTTGKGNGIIQKNPLPPVSIPKLERRRTVSFRKGVDPREELLRRSTTPDVKDVSFFFFH